MADELQRGLLEEIFKASIGSSKGISAKRFRAEHYQYLDLLDRLELEGRIVREDDKYYVKLIAIYDLLGHSQEADGLFFRCERVFEGLRQHYRETYGASIELNRLAERLDIPRRDVNIALSYMKQTPIIQGYTTKFDEVEEASVTPGEDVLKYGSFERVVRAMRSWQADDKEIAATPMAAGMESEAGRNVGGFEGLLHSAIVDHALQQYLNGHLRDAVLNSVIAIFDLIREKTGAKEDGERLIGKVFSLENPYLVLSELDTESGRNDQKGFMQIFKGVFQGVRNPKAHSLTHDLTQVKAAQYLVFASLLARRVEDAVLVKREDE